MLAQMYGSEQRPIGFDQKDMMKTNLVLAVPERPKLIVFQSVKENVMINSVECRRQI